MTLFRCWGWAVASPLDLLPVDREHRRGNQAGSFAVRNGQVTFSISVTPLSTLTCPGNQVVVIESVSYDLNLTWIGFPSLDAHLVG